MSRGAALRATERYLAIFVAFAMQLIAVAVIGDIFATAPRADAALLPPDETVARVAPVARGDRLMTINLAFDRISASAPADAAPATDQILEPGLDSSAEAAPGSPAAEPEPEPLVIAEPTPQPRPQPTAAPRPVPAPPAITTSLSTQQSELRMLALMNASRLQAGLVPLALDGGVSDAARRHSAAEAQVRYVYHDGPDGTAASRNVPACGTGWYGENTGKVWSGGVDVLHREFMAEPWEPINHRTNIMDPNFRRVGVGAVEGPDAMYLTMVFCR
ncbi:MAG: CAP domain-containing protein [Chloroflexota bacterium]